MSSPLGAHYRFIDIPRRSLLLSCHPPLSAPTIALLTPFLLPRRLQVVVPQLSSYYLEPGKDERLRLRIDGRATYANSTTEVNALIS